MRKKTLKMAWRRNSKADVLACAPLKPDIIEVDLRKSKDGVLYCYHGILPLAYFLRFFKYTRIQKWLHTETLKEVTEVIPERAILYCDMKQNTIGPALLQKTLKTFSGEVWLAAYSIPYLSHLKQHLGNGLKYIYNFGFLQFKKGLKEAEAAGLNGIQIFPWQGKAVQLKQLKKAGIDHGICVFPLGHKKHVELSKKTGAAYILF